MVNESNVYEQIFAGVRNSSELAQAIARAVRQLREAMEKEDNCAVTEAHVRNLREIDPAALASAYALAEESCTYWPTPGQIRELAGWSEEAKSRSALQWVFQYLAMHGPEGRARGGGVRFGEDETGRRVLLEPEAVIPAPEIPAGIEATLTALGSGSAKQGLRYVSQHPVAKGWENFHGDAASRTAERIETQWIRCSLHTRKGRKAPGSNETPTIPPYGGRDEY
ncbi:MAG: hypothetical protein ABSC65_07005 [Acidobacteriaceae bacterium]|jgi:hypothetical protein